MDTSETTEQLEKHFYADWGDRIKNILRSENNSLTFVVGQQQISFNKGGLCFFSPVVDKLLKELAKTSCYSSVHDHIYVTLTDHKFAKSLAFLQELLQTGIIQHISCSDAENLPGLFAFLELDISFDAIEATTIIPKYESKAEATYPIMDIKTEIVKSETAVIFPKVEIKEEDHHGEMGIKVRVKSEPDNIFDSNVCADTEYIEVEEEVNGLQVKTEAATKADECFKDGSAMDYSAGYKGPSPLPVGRFQYSIVTPWFDQQQVENQEVPQHYPFNHYHTGEHYPFNHYHTGEPPPFNHYHTEEPSPFYYHTGEHYPFNHYHTGEPSPFNHYHTGEPSPFNHHTGEPSPFYHYHTDAFSAVDNVKGSEEEGINRSGNSNIVSQKGEERKLYTEEEHLEEREMRVNHLRVCSSTLWIGHLSKHTQQLAVRSVRPFQSVWRGCFNRLDPFKRLRLRSHETQDRRQCSSREAPDISAEGQSN